MLDARAPVLSGGVLGWGCNFNLNSLCFETIAFAQNCTFEGIKKQGVDRNTRRGKYLKGWQCAYQRKKENKKKKKRKTFGGTQGLYAVTGEM